MPNAFACVGLFIGIVGTAFMGLLITGSLQLLLKIHHLMCTRLRKPILVYDQVVVATLTTDVRKPWLSARTATFVISVIALFHAGYLYGTTKRVLCGINTILYVTIANIIVNGNVLWYFTTKR